jgi:hypothetical protein
MPEFPTTYPSIMYILFITTLTIYCLISTHSTPPTDHVVLVPALGPAAAVSAAEHTHQAHLDNYPAKSDYNPYSGSAVAPAAAVAGRSPGADLIAAVRPIAVVAGAADPMVGAVVAVVEVEVRRIVGVRVGRRDCIASVGRDCRRTIVSFGIGGLGLERRRTGRIRGVGEEVADTRSRGRRTIVGVTCRAVDLMLWSLGSVV